MKKQTLLKRATAAALLTATLAAPAVIGLTAGTAGALPIESPNCAAIERSVDSAIYMAHQAGLQGDQKARTEYLGLAARAHANYNRHCLS